MKTAVSSADKFAWTGYVPGRSLSGPIVSFHFHRVFSDEPSRLFPPGKRKKEPLMASNGSARNGFSPLYLLRNVGGYS